jgi:DNA-binding GntR family transcriptional regulator
MPKKQSIASQKASSLTAAGGGVPLFEMAYNRIKEMIFQRKLAPGQRLILKDLCQVLDISRTPVINALTKLEEEGYVKSESFRGFYVKPIDIQEISDGFGIREALEVYAIEQALKHLKPGDIEDLKTKIADHEAYMPPVYDKQKFYYDAAVHIRIAEMTGNQGLVQLLTKNLEHVYLRLALHNHLPDRMIPAVQEHKALLKLMESKDEAGCIALMRRHIQKGRDHVIASLEREETYQAL